MSIFGKATGIFDLNNSDKNVGSLFHKNDITILLNYFKNSDLSEIKFNKYGYIDELKVLKLWNKNKIISAKERNKRCFDEIILMNLIEKAYPLAEIKSQVKWNSDRRKQIDFLVGVGEKQVIIEFDGPSHYVHLNKNWK